MKNNSSPEKLVEFIRDGLVEQEHFGFVIKTNNENEIEKIGDDNNYPFYLRSCAKPLQATLLIDYHLDKEFNMTEQEIAICAASHAGEYIHTELVKGLLEKFEIPIDKLKCSQHEPISQSARNELILKNLKPTVVHNNCSGKHTMMLGICKLKGWDLDNYDEISHPLQQEIKKRVYELCEIQNKKYPITKDGCGVPILSMPLKNIVKGYLNLFCNPKYEKIKNAFLHNPYIIGGENRTDTKIISSNKQNNSELIAKVGAGGLCVVINTKLEEGFIVKICDANMNAREILCADLIENLRWGKVETNHYIKTLRGDTVGEIRSLV